MRVRCGDGEHFSLRQSDMNGSIDFIVYIWNADDAAEIFIVTPSEALRFLGERALKTKSWIEQKYYKWSSATGLPKSKRQDFIRRFSVRESELLPILRQNHKKAI